MAALAAAWIWLSGAAPAQPHVATASVATFLAAVVMWQAMMVAMMTPTVLPWVLSYARLVGDAGTGHLAPSWAFAGGYFTVWLAYSAAAAALQMALTGLGLLGHDGPPRLLAGGVLMAAGAFQFVPLKQACLTHCRNPLSYLLSRWRGGPPSGFGLGLRHGAYCVGCCWLLMVTGFAIGLMNLAWMALLTVVVGLEQIAPGGVRLGQLFGAGLILWGGALCWPA